MTRKNKPIDIDSSTKYFEYDDKRVRGDESTQSIEKWCQHSSRFLESWSKLGSKRSVDRLKNYTFEYMINIILLLAGLISQTQWKGAFQLRDLLLEIPKDGVCTGSHSHGRADVEAGESRNARALWSRVVLDKCSNERSIRNVHDEVRRFLCEWKVILQMKGHTSHRQLWALYGSRSLSSLALPQTRSSDRSNSGWDSIEHREAIHTESCSCKKILFLLIILVTRAIIRSSCLASDERNFFVMDVKRNDRDFSFLIVLKVDFIFY